MQHRQAASMRQNLANNVAAATGGGANQPTHVLAAQQIAHLQQQQQQRQALVHRQAVAAAAAAGLTPEQIAQLTSQQLAQFAQQQAGQQMLNAQLQQQQQQQAQQAQLQQQQQLQAQLLQNPQLLLQQQQILAARQGVRPQLNQAQLQNAQLQNMQQPQAAQVVQAAQAAQLLQAQQQVQNAGMQLTPQQVQQLARAAALANAAQQNNQNNFGSPRPPNAGTPQMQQQQLPQQMQQPQQQQPQLQQQQPQQQQQQQQQQVQQPQQPVQPQPPQPQPQQQQPQAPQQQQQQPQQPPNPHAHILEIRARLAQLPEAERNKAFEKNPKLRALFYGNINLQSQQLVQQAQAQAAVQQQAQQGQVSTPQASTPQAPSQAPTPQQVPAQPPQQPPMQLPNNGQGVQSPAMMQARPIGFPVLNQSNLYIPPNKQRNMQAQSQSPGPQSPAVRPNLNAAMAAAQQQQQQQQQNQQRAFPQGLPINQNAAAGSPIRPPGMVQVPPGQHLTPGMILSDLDKKNVVPTAQAAPMRPTNEVPGALLDRSQSVMSKTTWQPTPETDKALQEQLLLAHQVPARSAGRATLLEGLATNPVLTNVLGEQLPSDLRALADGEIESKAELDKGKKHELEGATGLPGQKKMKMQEFAETIDASLNVDWPVEDVLLNLTDEYVDLVSQTSSQLAKHRKSATIDRKDVQFAYESLFGRALPGFSSDAIRLDQARSSKRAPMSQQRAAKLKLVNDAKAAWRKEKEEAAKAAEQAKYAEQAANALGVTVVPNGTANGSLDASTAATPGTTGLMLTTGAPSGVTTAPESANVTPAPTGQHPPAVLVTPAASTIVA